MIQENGTYTIYAKDSLGNDTVYEFEVTNIDESAVPNPIFTLDKEPYVFQGIDWYPYGTKLTITYAEDMTNLEGCYSSNGGESYSSNFSNKSRTETLSETKTWSAKIVDTTGEESETVTEEIHVMASPSRLQDNYKVVGNVYPVLVTGQNSGTVYGTDVYRVDSSIKRAALHMGLVSIGEEKVLKIKVVECPEEGYVASTRNGISTNQAGNSSGYGFVFIGDNGEEVKGPTIESISQVPADNEIMIGIEAQAYTGANIAKYYYRIDSGEYIESDNSTYTFTEVKAYVNHTIDVYVKDTRGSVSKVETITQRTANKIPTPVFTFDKEPYEIDGIKWYPYGTALTITYAEDMTNLTGCYSSNGGESYSSNFSSKSRTETLSETKTWSAKIVDTTGEESETVTEEIHVMANPSRLQTNYWVVGNVYPVLVTGQNSGTVYGTDVYRVDSSIKKAAVHMGLVSIGEKKVLKIKVVECPAEGYVASIRNGISTSQAGNSSGYGFVFIGDNGEEVKGPTIESISQVPADNEIMIGIEAQAYTGANIAKYYYRIDSGEYIESDNSTYTFTEVKAYVNHTIDVYVKDTRGSVSKVETITQRTANKIPTPVFTFDKEPYEIDGIKWYPYGTALTITYAEDMTNLTGCYSSNGGESYSNNSNYKKRIETLSETKTWAAKIVDTTGETSEIVTEEIHVMASPSRLQDNYKVVGNVYPVLVTGSNSGSTVYGTDVYRVDSTIQRAAVHMGLVSIGEKKVLKIKVVECPEEGYVASTRNGISTNQAGNSSGYGFVFIGDNGEEVKGPTIESISQVPADNEIMIGIEAQAYTGANIAKYYYRIDSGEYIESDNSTYTFTEVKAYVNHTIDVYVKDTRGSVSKVETITQRTANKIPTPVFTFDKEPYEIDGIKWYPYGTALTITYAEDMTNLTGCYSSNGGESYSNNSNYKKRIETLSETKTWAAKIVDTTGEASEIVTEEIHVMASPTYLQTNYKVVGNIYPVLVTGQNSGTVYGTDVYRVDSSIKRAAVHMGLVSIGEEKVLKIKVVECPAEGYVASIRNGISTSSTGYSSGSSGYGFIFIGDNGEEVKGPTIESILSSKKNAIEVKNNAKAYNGATIEKYYYSINNGQYVESTQNSYTFTGLTEGTEYTIKTYAKDSNNSSTIITENKTMTGDFPDGLTVIKSSGNLTSYRGRNNLILGVLVTGSNSGSLWGTETYTDDSSLAAAVVHMGIAKANQTVLVKVQILPGQESYSGTTQNGITSSNYSSYSGSYKILDGGPTIESITQVPADNEITIGIEAQAFRNKSIPKYYYKLDDGEYIESSSATYTFSNIEPYVIHKVSVYAKDTEGFSSEEKTINIKVSGKVTLSGYSLIYNNDYGFVNDGDTVVPNNIGIHGTTANSYIVIDLSNYSEDSTHTVSIEAEVSSENNYDFGYATLTTDSTAPAYNSEEGRFVYISGTVENQKYTLSDIAGGKKYYLHLGYRKDGSNNSGDDKVIFRNLEVQ